MAARIFRINYKSDFILTLNSDAGWMTPFCIKFWTGAPSQAYYVGWDGETYTHCSFDPSEPTKLLVQFDDHHLQIGDLKFQVAYHFTVADFPNDTEDEVINPANITTEIDGETYQVMLDFTGETAPEIQFSLPAYANEAQRIANEEERIAHEQQRINDEQQRIANEETRQAHEAQRIAQETARINEFATLKSQSQAATRDANDAATLANQKAQLAADKAALANDAATLANQKAQLAADKAALANDAAQLANEKAALAQQKAEYAQTQGGYAKDQGDYAKNQGDYAKEQGDTALADHQRAESDHGIAVDDHTQAGNDHTRAESDHGIAVDDHTQAGNDHTRAESDHGIAVDDHTQAGNDHTRAESDHGIAADDHTQAGNDHTRAESDHTRAESDHAAVEVYVDSLGAFDISAYHATGGVLAKYADLTAALGTNGANIPDALRKGGMSVKYVHSSDNKYVQYRLMSDTFNTTVTNWQGVDATPTPDSINTVESGGVAGIFNKAFVNWRDQGGGGIQTLFSQVISSQAYILYDSVSLQEGDHIKFEASGGNGGDYTVYMYYTTSTNPKAKLGTFNNQTPLDIQSVSYGGYESYNRLTIVGTAGSVVTIKKLPSSPSGSIDLSDDLKNSVQSMIDASVEEGVSGLEKYKDIIIADNITAATNILKSSDGLNSIKIGDYIKVTIGNGTTGTWGLCTYSSAQNTGKFIYTESLVPGNTYHIKIINDFYRLFFYKLNSCDAPLSAWRINETQNDIIINSDNIELLEQNTNYSYYYEKGNAPEKFTRTPCFIVAGQSNAAGRVPVADLPSYIQFPMANVEAWGSVSFNELTSSYLAQNQWAFDLITLYYCSLVVPCKVVKYAMGATKINGSPNGTAWSADYEDLSNSLLFTLETKIRDAVASGAQIDFRAILWHQGEGDFGNFDAIQYYNNLKKVIAYLRGVCGNVKLPFISGTISHSSGSYNPIVEAAQLKVAAEDPYVTYIDMSGATLLDSYHFDAQSAEYLGKKVYDALIDYGVINGTKLNPVAPWNNA